MGELLVLAIAVITPTVALEVAGKPGWSYWVTGCVSALVASLPWLFMGGSWPVALSFAGGPVLCGFAALSFPAVRARPFAAWLLGAAAVMLATLIAAAAGVERGYLTP